MEKEIGGKKKRKRDPVLQRKYRNDSARRKRQKGGDGKKGRKCKSGERGELFLRFIFNDKFNIGFIDHFVIIIE